MEGTTTRFDAQQRQRHADVENTWATAHTYNSSPARLRSVSRFNGAGPAAEPRRSERVVGWGTRLGMDTARIGKRQMASTRAHRFLSSCRAPGSCAMARGAWRVACAHPGHAALLVPRQGSSYAKRAGATRCPTRPCGNKSANATTHVRARTGSSVDARLALLLW